MMAEISDLLIQKNIRKALIVDDSFDPVPLASDLAIEAEEWTVFFDDALAEDYDLMRQVFPAFDAHRIDKLPNIDEFVASLWTSMELFRPEHIGPVFMRYKSDMETDRKYLDSLVTKLKEFGLECDTAGRAFKAKAADADLVIIDLFLGSGQDDPAMKASVEGLLEAIGTRRERPPLIILMSRSPQLSEKYTDFRDSSKLYGSIFRFIQKSELSNNDKLVRLLTRLANNYQDSLKLATFFHAWQEGLSNAQERTAALIRKW